jgi:hypothetical protein
LADAKTTIGGGGGSDPVLAVAGGKKAEALDDALDQVRTAVAGAKDSTSG